MGKWWQNEKAWLWVIVGVGGLNWKGIKRSTGKGGLDWGLVSVCFEKNLFQSKLNTIIIL